MTNESKVVRYAFDTTVDYVNGAEYHQMVAENSGPFVTHADYRALEAHFNEVCDARNDWYECAERLKAQNEKLHQEINFIRSRAGDLVVSSIAARRELQSCQSVIHLHGGFDPAYVEGAQKAMRDLTVALEALK